MNEVETRKYTITGLVDYTDEQGNIVGQYPIGSVQELPVEVGTKAVEAGNAEAVGTAEGEDALPADEVVDDAVVADDAGGADAVVDDELDGTGDDVVVADDEVKQNEVE